MIPKIIFMCDKTLKYIQKYSLNWKRLNPHYEIRLCNDNMCEYFLLKKFSRIHRDVFKYIPDGPIKADFWRVCILYVYGGIYVDADNEPLVSIDSFLEKNIDFITCSTYWHDKPHIKFNPNFIATIPGHPFLKKCIQKYIMLYNNRNINPYGYWKWSIMTILSEVIDIENYNKKEGIYLCNNNQQIQIIQEIQGETHHDDHNIYNQIRIFNNRYQNWDSGTHSFKS